MQRRIRGLHSHRMGWDPWILRKQVWFPSLRPWYPELEAIFIYTYHSNCKLCILHPPYCPTTADTPRCCFMTPSFPDETLPLKPSFSKVSARAALKSAAQRDGGCNLVGVIDVCPLRALPALFCSPFKLQFACYCRKRKNLSTFPCFTPCIFFFPTRFCVSYGELWGWGAAGLVHNQWANR